MAKYCEMIEDKLLDYANRNLSELENGEVIMHLSRCKSCLLETAEIISIRKQLSLHIVELPLDMEKIAFKKIPRREKNYDEIMKSNSPFKVFEILGYTLSPVRKIINLALQGI